MSLPPWSGTPRKGTVIVLVGLVLRLQPRDEQEPRAG